MQVYAGLNIGSLKVKSLIAGFDEKGRIFPLHQSNELTCFGCKMYENEGNILDFNLEKTIQEILNLKEVTKKYDCKETRLFATNALRDAKNQDSVLKEIRGRTGLEVEIISPREEGELYFKAVVNDFTDNGEYAVCDIGGGSCQVLIGSKEGIRENYSFPTGSQLLHEKFTPSHHDPSAFTKEEDILKIKDYLVKQYSVLQDHSNLPIVYGSSNIIDLLKFLKIALEPNGNSGSHPYKTSSSNLKEFIDHIVQFPYETRDKMYPFQKGYMWGIDKAFLNVVTIGEALNAPYIIPTNKNVIDGFLYKMRENK